MLRLPTRGKQDALKALRAELATSLEDVEKELELMGGSASTVTARTAASAKTAKSKAKSFAASDALSQVSEE